MDTKNNKPLNSKPPLRPITSNNNASHVTFKDIPNDEFITNTDNTFDDAPLENINKL